MKPAPTPPQVSRAVRWTAYLIISTIILLVIVLGGELYFRSQPAYGKAGFIFDKHLIYRLTPELSAQKPYAWGKVGKPPFNLRFNNHGFRGPDIVSKKPANTKRILVLGDSYTAGLDFPDQEIFTAQWASLLNKSSSESFQVINASCPAWGTDQQYIYWKTQGHEIQADIVVIALSPNDIREMWNHKLVRFDKEKGQLIRNKARLPWQEQIGWKLAARSSFFQFIQHDLLKEDYGNFLRIFGF